MAPTPHFRLHPLIISASFSDYIYFFKGEKLKLEAYSDPFSA